MTLNKRVAVCVALFVAMNLFSAMAFGGILDLGPAYKDVSNVTWSGTTHFEHGTSGLEGDINWIVYGPGNFPYGGYAPASNQYTYAYQIVNTGTLAISDLTFDIDQEIGNVSSFQSSPNVMGATASRIEWESGPDGFVDWAFTGINGGGTSAGLVFTSPKAPTVTTTGIVTNGGTSAEGLELPAHGPNNVPEPGTIVLLLAALGFVASVRCFSRR